MSDFDRTKKNYRSGRTQICGRTFLIEFWEDNWCDLPWCRISEILIADVNSHWWSRKTEKREVKHYVDKGWMTGNRLKWAKQRISEYIQNEIDVSIEREQIKEFCKTNNS